MTGPEGVVGSGVAPNFYGSSSCVSGGFLSADVRNLLPGASYTVAATATNNGINFNPKAVFITKSTNTTTTTATATPKTDTATATTSTTPKTDTATATTTTATTTTATTSTPRSGIGGYAVVHPDGHVCGVIVGNDYFGGNDKKSTSEYMGCPIDSRIIFQTKPSQTGNVAGYHGREVMYSNGVFTLSNSGKLYLTIKDGIATSVDGTIFDTGSGAILYKPPTITTPKTDTATATTTSTSGNVGNATATYTASSVKTETGTVTTTSFTAIVKAETGTATTTTNTTVVLTKSDASTATKTVTTQIAKTVTESGAIITKTTQSFGTESAVITTTTTVAVTGSSKAVIAEVKEVIAPQKTSEVKALTDLLSRVSNKVEKTIVKTVNLPKKTPTTESAMSLAPEMCSVSGLVVTSLKKGLCTVAYTVTGSSNIPFTIEKTFNFTK
jgi:hypothetical protein